MYSAEPIHKDEFIMFTLSKINMSVSLAGRNVA
jgi:hypothetical protein